MKKIFSILLALCMLTLSIACAETVFSISDPVVSLNLGEAQTIDLTGLTLTIAVGEANGAPAVRIDILGDGSNLFGLDANVLSDKVALRFDGVSQVYYASMPNMPAVSDFDLSSLNIDTDALVETIMAQAEIDGDTIRIPYTAVNEVLEAFAPALEGIEIPGMDISELTAAIAQLKETNSGANLEITYVETESGFSASVKIIPVENGEALDVAITADVDFGEDGVNVAIDVPETGTLYCSAQPSGEQVAVVLGVSSSDMSGEISGIVSLSEADVSFAAIDASDAIDIETLTSEQTEALGMELMSAASGLIGYVFGAMDTAA